MYARTNEWTHALTQMTTYKRTLDGCINADKPRAHPLVFATAQARTRTLAHWHEHTNAYTLAAQRLFQRGRQCKNFVYLAVKPF